MPCNQLSSPTVRECRWWDRLALTRSDISLHRLDEDQLPVTMADFHNGHPIFLPSPVPSTGYCSNGLHDCLRAYENISQVREIIDNIVCPFIRQNNSHPVSFSDCNTLSFIILNQNINPSELCLVDTFGCITELSNNAFHVSSAQTVIFGQYTIKGTSYSAAIQLEIVAHEFCHMLISKIFPPDGFSYEGESGALEESFCDIFGVLVSARTNGTWKWKIGQNMSTLPGRTVRSFACPGKSNPPQPSHYRNRVIGGGAHINCGIHNKAFYHIIKSPYFEVDFLIELLIRTILTINIPDFSHSRKAMEDTARDMLKGRGLGDTDITIRVNAVSQAFDKVGIELPPEQKTVRIE